MILKIISVFVVIIIELITILKRLSNYSVDGCYGIYNTPRSSELVLLLPRHIEISLTAPCGNINLLSTEMYVMRMRLRTIVYTTYQLRGQIVFILIH